MTDATQRIIFFLNEAKAREHGHTEEDFPAVLGYYVVALNEQGEQFDAVGPYDSYEEAERNLITLERSP